MSDHDKIISALTDYDRKQSTRKGYNPYALPQYFDAALSVGADLGAGVPMRQAILNHFCDRVATAVLRSVGLPAITEEEARA